MTEMYFDDFATGQKFRTRGATLSESQILDFAFQYDPQPFHIDKLAAEQSSYGGLIASGFQTFVIGFRLWYAEGIINTASMGSPGVDELRWLKPVRPGDTIHLEAEVVDTRVSRSKPDRGVATIQYIVYNQNEEAVLSYRVLHILKRHPDLQAAE